VNLDPEQHIIKGWSFQDILLEFYRYTPCPPEWLPEHCHEEYQFCLSIDCPGEYYYRGTHYWVSDGSLSVIHPGEMHTDRDVEDRQSPATFRMMYVSPAVVKMAAAEVAGGDTNQPFFPFFAQPIVLDSGLACAIATGTQANTRHLLLLQQALQIRTVNLQTKSY
jgi:hypothetical protein